MKIKLSREFKIGFFGILMIACLYAGINFVKGMDLFTASRKYYAVYDQVNGLQSSASVVIKGFKVGTVSDMTYDPRISDKVIIELSVKAKYKIPKDSRARVFSEGIMSGKSVEIELGESSVYLNEGDTLFSTAEKDFLEVAGSEFEFIKQRANDLVTEMIHTLNNVNKLIAENSMAVSSTTSNLAAISGNLNSLLAEERGSIRGIITSLNSLTTSLSSKSGQIDRIINNVENFSDSLSQSQIPTMIAEMSGTLAQLNTALERINRGEGTVGKFLYDQQLYDALLESSDNLAALLSDLKQHPGRYLNISVFGRKNP